MFLTIISYTAFGAISVILVALLVDQVLLCYHAGYKKIHDAAGLNGGTLWNYRMYTICTVWVVSGIYLWR